MFFQEFFEMFIYIEKCIDEKQENQDISSLKSIRKPKKFREFETENFDALCYGDFYAFQKHQKNEKRNESYLREIETNILMPYAIGIFMFFKTQKF